MTSPSQDAREARRWSEQVARRVERQERHIADTLDREQARLTEAGKPGPLDVIDAADGISERLQEFADNYYDRSTTGSIEHMPHDLQFENPHVSNPDPATSLLLGTLILTKGVTEYADGLLTALDLRAKATGHDLADGWENVKERVSQVVEDVQHQLDRFVSLEQAQRDTAARELAEQERQAAEQEKGEEKSTLIGAPAVEAETAEMNKLLAEQQHARDEQAADIETMKQTFREAHEDDSPEQSAAHEKQLAAAEELAQQTLAAKQEEERQALQARQLEMERVSRE